MSFICTEFVYLQQDYYRKICLKTFLVSSVMHRSLLLRWHHCIETKKINDKARRLEQEGRIIRLKHGLYVRSADDGAVVLPSLVANHLYGPSYVSMQTALRHYGLIPERVYEIQSMTIKHSRIFDTPLGRFSYIGCAADYFPIGIRQEQDDDYIYLIASPEKALCDLMVKTAGLNTVNTKKLTEYFEYDLRFDMDALMDFAIDLLEQCRLHAMVKNEMIAVLIKLISN